MQSSLENLISNIKILDNCDISLLKDYDWLVSLIKDIGLTYDPVRNKGI